MAVTPNMGLIKWSALADPYDHTQLAGNFQKIDEHDHTSGKGIQIPTAGIADNAITTAKVLDAAITNEKLAGNISASKLGAGVTASLGDLKFWWRPNGSTSVPTGGWVIAAGQSLIAAEHEFPGGGTIILPNLIGKFPQGAETADIGVTGGVATININHSHAVNSHTHNVPAHLHSISLESGFGAATNLKISQDLAGNAWVHSDNENNVQHRHSINGNVGSTSVVTEGSTASTDSALSSAQSIVPPFVGLLPLLKVKNS